MRIPKGGTPFPPAKVRAEGEHQGFNKTTETQSSQRKALPFYGGKEIKVRLESGKCLFMIVRYCESED